jgi:monoterpene epsilon-lactone hydrolase
MKLDPRRLLVHSVLRRMIRKRPVESVAEYVGRKQQNPDSYAPPTGREAVGIDISELKVDTTLVYRLTPGNAGHRCFVYFHGGSYIGEIIASQWELVMELARGAGNTCLVPIYSLAPRETAEQTVVRAAAAIGAAVEEFGAENVSVFGDSAGGGIAVAAAQQMRDAGAELPARLILLAPWLDASLTHPDQDTIQPHDIMVRRDYLVDAARAYAGDLPIDDPRVSPLHGSFADLPPMHVMTGSHDVVVTDSRQLVERIHALGGEIDYLEAPGMQHVYPVLPLLPEARAAKRRIIELLG